MMFILSDGFDDLYHLGEGIGTLDFCHMCIEGEGHAIGKYGKGNY